jgi:hypothetical protein
MSIKAEQIFDGEMRVAIGDYELLELEHVRSVNGSRGRVAYQELVTRSANGTVTISSRNEKQSIINDLARLRVTRDIDDEVRSFLPSKISKTEIVYGQPIDEDSYHSMKLLVLYEGVVINSAYYERATGPPDDRERPPEPSSIETPDFDFTLTAQDSDQPAFNMLVLEVSGTKNTVSRYRLRLNGSEYTSGTFDFGPVGQVGTKIYLPQLNKEVEVELWVHVGGEWQVFQKITRL